MKPRSKPYRCDKGKSVKEFYFGTLTRYVWNSKEKVYVAKEQKSVFCCRACDKCTEFNDLELCEFTDIDNIATGHGG